MLTRFYQVFGALVLLGYAVCSYEGWELGSPTRQGAPGASVGGGGSGGRSSWWFFGGGRGGK